MAKVDTGAQTSSLHATEITEIDLDGKPGVRFRVHPDHKNPTEYLVVTAKLRDVRPVVNSGGSLTQRKVIQTTICIGELTLNAEVTLIDRTRMRYPMLIGRTTLRKGGLLVDSRKSWIQGQDNAL